jgi:septum formation protein
VTRAADRPFIILGSASPRRRELLKDFYRLRIIPANCDERLKKYESPRTYVKRIAREKWKAVAKQIQNQKATRQKFPIIIVTADTTVALGSEILGKAASRAQAKKIIQKLSGKTHHVFTSVCVGWSQKKSPRYKILVDSRVIFRKLEANEIESYLRSNEWKDKAGAYAIQGNASKFVDKISGSLTNIVGLPLQETKSLIAQCFSHPL